MATSGYIPSRSIDDTWVPLNLSYTSDANVALESIKYRGDDDLKLNFYSILKDPKDVKVNNHSCLFLTGKKQQQKEILVNKPAGQSYPRSIVTHLALNHTADVDPVTGAVLLKYTYSYDSSFNEPERHSLGLVCIGSPDKSYLGTDLPSYSAATDDYFFELEFVSEGKVKIYHQSGLDRMQLYVLHDKAGDPVSWRERATLIFGPDTICLLYTSPSPRDRG